MHRRALLLTAVSLTVGGCASWNNKPSHEVSLQPLLDDAAKRESSKPRLTVTFLPVQGDPQHVVAIDRLWETADVGPITSETRRRWQENGCRIGVLPQGDEVKRIVEATPVSTDPHQRLVATADIRDDSCGTRKTVQMPIGKPHQIVPGQPFSGSQTFICNFDGRVVGRTLDAAQTMIVAKLLATIGREGMRLELVPNIQFGQSQRKFVSSEAAIRIDSDRPTWELEPLTIHWDAAAGDTLLIGPASDDEEGITGLARDFLSPAGRPMLIALTAEISS